MRCFGLIGFPLKNTFSVNYFTEKFKQLGFHDHIFENYPIENIDQVISIIENNKNLDGLCITIPHKISIIDYLDEIEETAKIIGAVNCVKIIRNQQTSNKNNFKLIGYNTDAVGFEQSLNSFINNKTNISNALIIGTGGASKAIAFVLFKLDISFAFVTRKVSNNNSSIKQYTYEMLDEKIIMEHQLIINCSPIGMFPNETIAPDIPYHFLTPYHFAFDLIYLPNESLFLKKAKEQGAKTKNGLEMLHLQADKAWELFK
jgi:shikimate dehydrogenase